MGKRTIESEVKLFNRPKMEKPLLIEGLPGIGYVGKLAAEHLIEEFEAEKFGEINSPFFPHHVSIDSGILRPAKNEFYLAELEGKDVIILVGDVQATSSEGHYELANKVLDTAESFDVSRIFTLGGYATGQYSKSQPKVFGVVNHPKLLEEYGSDGLVIREGTGPIIGISGLLLGLGSLRGINGVCLLGETHGMLVDHRSARSVLEALSSMLGFKVDLSKLEEHAKKTESILLRMRKVEKLRKRRKEREEEVSYIG